MCVSGDDPNPHVTARLITPKLVHLGAGQRQRSHPDGEIDEAESSVG